MHDLHLLINIAVALVTAFAGGLLARRLGLPTIVGYLTLHLPLSPSTHHFVAQAEIGRLAPGAYVINTARGGLVDEQALLDGLESGRLAGAALDALEVEPALPNHSLRYFIDEGQTRPSHR
jgi:lactate dehydrogenase-like 2-hydroxyacid dehydrogenase